MAIIKCKMCGGDLDLVEGASTAECEFCGSIQTIPKVDDEKKLTLFARANRLRSACEFDKAAGIYEAIVADFPDEAEAYWGLVLCKYGIEYVDDPATGKKIPTCHRSSYDSVMDDSNFEQAVENADLIAQRVYREEAKQIEKIRKGILEVSSKEQPYDIFICYKETAPNGDRTLDSVLAQDLYSALTDKGYRVFFSRITLQGKLGEAYEPYIFAALNSAKVMLAVGTCYEYYNAVWVKNEWSRYLKICEADKSKHLIPCYKNLDPEDMPKEFNHLQGADLGKMGAVQDILFNMEKYIPLKKQTTTVIQEKVVVGGPAGNKIASLLDRGNMALEDGDWAKADSFFEDVLNNDSKNAQAYLGKTLAQEKCRTIDAFVRKRKDACNTTRTQTYTLTPRESHIKAVAEELFVSGYLDKAQIRKMYEFDLSYSTQVPFRKQQYKDEESYWANHKLLSKAEKFATGAVADNLQTEKKTLFSYLSDLVKKAEDAETVAREKVLQGYNAHIAQTDEEVAQLREKSLQRREKDYQKWLQEAKQQSDAGNSDTVLRQLRLAAEFFEAQKEYKDSASLAQHCRKRIEDIKAENARIAAERYAAEQAEAERLRIEAEKAAEAKRLADEKAAAEKKKKLKTTVSIISAIAVVCIVTAVIMVTVVIPNKQYNAAVALMESGSYDEAINAFEAMDGYKDAEEQICKIYLVQGVQEMEAGNYETALELFEDASLHVDVTNEQDQCYYQLALGTVCQGKGGGKEWIEKIQNPSAFPDYEDWALLCELVHNTLGAAINGVDSGAAATEFLASLSKMEAIINKLSTDVKLHDCYAKLKENIDYYGKYLTETGEYTTLFSDGSGGGYASLTITPHGLNIYGPGPGGYLKDGALSMTTDIGGFYYSADSYTYTLLEDGRVKVVETDNGRSKTHYILPEK